MKLNLTTAIIPLALMLGTACVQPAKHNFDSLNKFQGSWKMTSPEMIMSEHWVKTNDTLWQGKSYIENNGKQELEETVQLVIHNHMAFYIVKRKGVGEQVAFKLIKQERDKFTFENKNNDFPQQIIYHFKADGNLDASINATTKDGFKTFEFPYKKI